ncbi:MAG: TetR family transcriptional regulator [Clostridia bacterium]|nr:TetR family transcriptional regulator [Clostridia bacterium]
MYCGSNKTALASQQQIAQAMMRLIRVKPYAQISISELCKEADISRQTFYTLFTSRENVMIFTLQSRYCCTGELERTGRENACVQEGLQGLCRGYSRYLVRNRELIHTLVENQIDYLLYDSFFEALNQSECLFGQLEAPLRSYASSFYAGGVSCIAKQYALNGCTATEAQLEELLIQLFTGSLFHSL